MYRDKKRKSGKSQTCSRFRRRKRNIPPTEGKGGGVKNSQGKIRKLNGEVGKWEFEGLSVDRSKSQQEIDTQIDRLDDDFQKKVLMEFTS